MYEGLCTSNYLAGMLDLFSVCTALDIPLVFQSLSNDSIIQRARNSSVACFLETDFTHFFFIDADIGFTAKDVLSVLLCMIQDTEKKYSVIGGPCPKKTLSWERIKSAVDKGLVKDDPNSLNRYGAAYAFIVPPKSKFRLHDPSEVLRVGTGFMLIARKTFEDFKQTYPSLSYEEEGLAKPHAFFDCIIDPETKAYLGEDFTFCKHVIAMNGRIWIAPWLQLSHQGSYTFQGSLAETSLLYNLARSD